MSCLFDSVGFLVGSAGWRLRRDVCDWMQRHMDVRFTGDLTIREWIQCMGVGGPAEKYVARMRLPFTWGGALESTVMARMLGVDVFTVNMRGVQIAHAPAVAGKTARFQVWIRWDG